MLPGAQWSQPAGSQTEDPAQVPFLSLTDGAILSSRATVVNSCSSTAKHLCNFVCYCSDCSDENQCGYLGVSAVLGTPFTCDFEEGDCGWQDVSTTAYRWVRGRASLDKWGTGLHSDHTVGTDRGKWELLCGHPQHCPSGAERSHTLDGESNPGKDRVGSTAQWGSELPVGASKVLTPCPTAPAPGQQVCGAEENRCSQGSCLAPDRFCDGTDDCGDSSDEAVQRSPWGLTGCRPPCPCSCSCSDRWKPLCEGVGVVCPGRVLEAGCFGWGCSVVALPQPLRLFPCPGAFLALQEGEGQMVAPAKARTPLLGPSGLACSMEMSYHIQSGPQGSPCLAWGQLDIWGTCLLSGFFIHTTLTMVTSLWPELSCNFETGLCGWYQDQASDFQWVHSTGQGQGSDHTTGSGKGSAPLLEAWPTGGTLHRGQRAQLITYGQEPAATPRCLTFWYRLAGPQIGTLNLKLQLEGAEETVLWTQRGTQGSLWHRGLATLPATGQQRYRLAFEALRDGFVGDAALDDLLVTEGTCGAELSCSFEADTCGLTGSTQPTWLRQSNSTGTIAGPPADHTTGTAAGHYMVVSTSKGSLPMGHKATLTSAPYQPSAPAQCLAFWYHTGCLSPVGQLPMGRHQGAKCLLCTMPRHSMHPALRGVPGQGLSASLWRTAIFEVVGAGGDYGYIALDDLHVSDGACPEPGRISCDFELDMCGWSSPVDEHLHSFAWGWKSGVPLAKYPGPEQDHTLGTKNGHYVHFDTRMLGAGGTTAQLVSQHLPATADSCLRFWYHMDIPEHLCKSDGELRVRLQSASGQRTAWTVAGHSSRGWQNGTVPVQSPSEFQVSGAVLGAIPGCWSLSLCITPNNLSSLADYL
uniref:MAM domain containing 4 n=1 Tax=Cairina moschata TaxID=8855 RepID=A0A8C3CA91_CAIMO